MNSLQNILVAVDFSENDKRLLDYALQMAKKFDSKVWIIHVALPGSFFIGYETEPKYVRNLRAEDLRTEHKTLKGYADDLLKEGLQADALLVEGLTAETISEELRKLQIDLFIMGAHKHGFLDRLFSENNPSQLAIKSKIPVMIIP